MKKTYIAPQTEAMELLASSVLMASVQPALHLQHGEGAIQMN